MGRRRHADSPEKSDALGDGQAAPCWMARHRHADSPEQRDAVGDGQVPPCRFSGAERRRAGWAGVAMQILRSRATPWVMGRRRRAGWPGTAMQILRSR
ncbi:Hypothetical predicted protein, partial [Cloeon dipterum]